MSSHKSWDKPQKVDRERKRSFRRRLLLCQKQRTRMFFETAKERKLYCRGQSDIIPIYFSTGTFYFLLFFPPRLSGVRSCGSEAGLRVREVPRHQVRGDLLPGPLRAEAPDHRQLLHPAQDHVPGLQLSPEDERVRLHALAQAAVPYTGEHRGKNHVILGKTRQDFWGVFISRKMNKSNMQMNIY